MVPGNLTSPNATARSATNSSGQIRIGLPEENISASTIFSDRAS
jgi:hypothetical protein